MLPEDIERFIKRYARIISDNKTKEKIKWKGKTMSKKHWQNWQYATTKEVLAIHEVIEPYDWQLDIEYNEDFAKWQNEIDNKA